MQGQQYDSRDFQQRGGGGSMFGGTPWGVAIAAIIVLGVLAMTMGETKSGNRSGTLDKVDGCCSVISGDKTPNRGQARGSNSWGGSE